MVKHSKEWLGTYQSNPIKYNYMHWASAGTFYFYLLSFIDFFLCNILSFSKIFYFTFYSILTGNLKTYVLDESTVR